MGEYNCTKRFIILRFTPITHHHIMYSFINFTVVRFILKGSVRMVIID